MKALNPFLTIACLFALILNTSCTKSVREQDSSKSSADTIFKDTVSKYQVFVPKALIDSSFIYNIKVRVFDKDAFKEDFIETDDNSIGANTMNEVFENINVREPVYDNFINELETHSNFFWLSDYEGAGMNKVHSEIFVGFQKMKKIIVISYRETIFGCSPNDDELDKNGNSRYQKCLIDNEQNKLQTLMFLNQFIWDCKVQNLIKTRSK